MKKRTLWLLLADASRQDIHCAVPTLAWIAEKNGALFECYLECERNGDLFARNGSTVIGGHHHQQFNYLASAFDVKCLLLGDTSVFRSSIELFHLEVIAESSSLLDVYEAALGGNSVAEALLLGPESYGRGAEALELGPYFFPEIFYRKALAVPASLSKDFQRRFKAKRLRALFHSAKGLESIDSLRKGDGYGSVSLRIAKRWEKEAKALAFGDPAAIRAQLATLCRERRLALYAPKVHKARKDIECSAYTEDASPIGEELSLMAKRIGNKVLVGRQTGDGDLFAWSKSGLCLQIMDPNRPAFPVVSTLRQRWAGGAKGIWDEEPDDETLLRYAKEGKVLSTLLCHSGEMAHNEAMLALFDLICFTGVKMGFGVHAARYQTCPQLWELLSVPKSKGGVLGFAEPLLHSGGMGVLAESSCPPADLRKHCENALKEIRDIAGGFAPKGYYAFMDSDLPTLSSINRPAFEAARKAGLEYFVSSALPGLNRALYGKGHFMALNQSCRVVHPASPFVRITSADDLQTAPGGGPGWLIGTLDAPVIAFAPYVWRHGSRFMRLVEAIKGNYVNVLPRTVARYAALLEREGFLRALKPQRQARTIQTP